MFSLPTTANENNLQAPLLPRLGSWLMTTVIVFAVCQTTTPAACGQNDKPLLSRDAIQKHLATVEAFTDQYCIECHSASDAEHGYDIESLSFEAADFLDAEPSGSDSSTKHWELALRRVDTRQMPPSEATRPSEDEYRQLTDALTAILDDRSVRFPRPGRTNTLRRLTRTEYQNAIRDLLAVDVNAVDFLPVDQSSHGFDNITVQELSPLLLNRYITAAQMISRAAVGSPGHAAIGTTIRIPPDRSQEEHVAGAPFGTRGGIVFNKQFHLGGEYEIVLTLTRDRDEKVEGLNRDTELDLLLDRKRIKRFTIVPPKGKGKNKDYSLCDSHLRTRLLVPAGEHEITVTFPKTFSSLTQDKRQPFDTNFNRHRHPRKTPALFQVSLLGPLGASASDQSTGDRKNRGAAQDGPARHGLRSHATRSQRLIFADDQTPEPGEELAAAKRILSRLTRRAYRRKVTDDDLAVPLSLFEQALPDEGFESAIEFAVASVLANPNFLFRTERESPTSDDPNSAKHQRRAYAIDDFELASRLSFFLWSSIPDDELLDLAERGELQSTDVLTQQVKRMLLDERAESLVNNFASQWLYLRNLDATTPNLRSFPDFDDNLRQAFREETEHLFRHVWRNDLSVLQLIDSDFTFLNQRLAKHYDLPNVKGSHFRKVMLDPGSHRGGILRHGSILLVTSYATRTSPTIRGNWILENIFGTPTPPPPPNIPALQEASTVQFSSVRERLAQHRANPTCASCHNLIDPVGFSMENFDAVGRWRVLDGSTKVDSAGQLPDGTKIDSVTGLEQSILRRPDTFIRTLSEKLLTFGLGRSVTANDAPAIRQIVSHARDNDFRFSAIVTGIVNSPSFRMRNEP